LLKKDFVQANVRGRRVAFLALEDDACSPPRRPPHKRRALLLGVVSDREKQEQKINLKLFLRMKSFQFTDWRLGCVFGFFGLSHLWCSFLETKSAFSITSFSILKHSLDQVVV
jgi:hypothetical protein